MRNSKPGKLRLIVELTPHLCKLVDKLKFAEILSYIGDKNYGLFPFFLQALSH